MHRRDFTLTVGGAFAGVLLPDSLRGLERGTQRADINAARLITHLRALSQVGANPEGGVSRVAYRDAGRAGRAWATEKMRAAGLDVSIDVAGNIIGRRAGSVAGLRPLLFGSHIDSVPGGGNFDGPVGSLGAIEVAQTFAEQKIHTRH